MVKHKTSIVNFKGIIIYDFSSLNLEETSKENCFGCDNCDCDNCNCDCDCDSESHSCDMCDSCDHGW